MIEGSNRSNPSSAMTYSACPRRYPDHQSAPVDRYSELIDERALADR